MSAVAGDRAAQAADAAARLQAQGVRLVMLTIVDNGGVARARAVPVAKFERAAVSGVGLSTAWHFVTATDIVASAPGLSGPAGDLRLVADPWAVRPLAGVPGWAWAPADQYTQDGEPHPSCSRGYVRRMAQQALDAGLVCRMSFEIEWFLGVESAIGVAPAHDGPGVGAQVLLKLSDFVSELMDLLARQQVQVEAVNSEYADGQLELAFAPTHPVEAADLNVLVRLTIHALAQRHGYRASFSPAFGGPMGNGGHVHLSAWRGGTNLMQGGAGPHGMTVMGESFLAGILRELRGMTAVGAPTPASFLRLQPSRWAGAFQCWGLENREAALRFITGPASTRSTSANAEVKCFDEASNPYLVLGALVAAGTAGVQDNVKLPSEYSRDPAAEDPSVLAGLAIRRLPASLDEAISAFAESAVLRETMGQPLHQSFLAVRRAEADGFRNTEDDAVIAAFRWRF